MLERFNFLFPVWALMLSAIAFYVPQYFLPLKPAIIYLLAVVMFGMGITLSLEDFVKLANLKTIIVIGLCLQFLLMPLAAWLISKVFSLSIPLLTGMLLVGASPGGTASNVICYLARGNVALSIALTSFSTFLAFVATPFLTWIYLGQTIEVPVGDMMMSVLKIVILPVSIGVLVNTLWINKFTALRRIFPSISVMAICVIIAIIVAANQTKLASIAVVVIFAVMLHNISGLALGYSISYALGHDLSIRKTLAIEVGMQNSGLAVALASEYFKPLAALPGAVFSIWHNLSGSLLAAIWSRNKDNEK